MGREDPQLKLRLSEELKRRVTEVARRNNRSVNAEIVSLLEDAFGEIGYDETLERYSVELQHLFRGAETTSVEKRLSDIEAKLDRLLALEEHFCAESQQSSAKRREIREQLSDAIKDQRADEDD